MMASVRIGMVGSGFMAHTYSEVVAHYAEGGELVAIAGGSRAPSLAERYGVPCEPTIAQLLARDDVDAVVLAGPETLRLEQTRAAAAAGKHVLSEKPMATSVAECDAMIAACDAAEVRLMIVQTQRFRGVHQRAKRLITEGKIGAVRQLRLWSLCPEAWTVPVVEQRPWYADPDAGIFMSQGVHNFDLMRWLAGSEARRVFAHVGSHGTHGLPNLSTVAIVEFASGAVGQLWTSLELPGGTFPDSQFRSQVVGERGLLDFDGYTHLDMATAEDGGEWRRVWTQPPLDPMDPLDPVRLESFTGQVQDFLDCIREGRPPVVTGADGRAAVELCQAALLSGRTGRAVELPL
jgi:predicted dehydrogenase